MPDVVQHTLPPRPVPYFLGAAEGEKLVMFDQLFTLLATSAQTDRQFDSFVSEGHPGRPVPPHFHAETHETFFVLDGAIRLWMDDQHGSRATRILEAGDFGFVPVNTIHSYRVERTARVFGVTSGGFADFFRAVARPTDVAGIPTPADFHIPAPELLATQGAQHDVHFVESYELFD